MKYYLLMYVCVFCFKLSAINYNLPPSATLSATNGLFLLNEKPSSVAINPALQANGVEIGYCDVFQLNQVKYSQIHFSKQFKDFGLYCGMEAYNHELINEMSYKLSLSKNIFTMQLGTGFKFINCKIKDEESQHTCLIDVGIGYKYNTIESFLVLKNISQADFASNHLPVVFLWNISNEVCDSFKLCFGMEKEELYEMSFKFGSQYNYKCLGLLTSYQYKPDRFGVGINFKINRINISASLRTHQFLNNTIHYAVNYEM